jgi:hypothetical protein
VVVQYPHVIPFHMPFESRGRMGGGAGMCVKKPSVDSRTRSHRILTQPHEMYFLRTRFLAPSPRNTTFHPCPLFIHSLRSPPFIHPLPCPPVTYPGTGFPAAPCFAGSNPRPNAFPAPGHPSSVCHQWSMTGTSNASSHHRRVAGSQRSPATKTALREERS